MESAELGCGGTVQYIEAEANAVDKLQWSLILHPVNVKCNNISFALVWRIYFNRENKESMRLQHYSIEHIISRTFICDKQRYALTI